MKLKTLIGVLALFCAQVASATIYTYTDANGAQVFTDRPPKQKNVETLNIVPSNQLPVTPITTPINPPPVYMEQVEPLPVQYEMLRILVPEPDATIRANDQQLIVTVSSEPSLHAGHRYRFILDGQPVGEATRSPVLQLKGVERGTHILAVEIINENDAVLERTPAQPFHLRQTTLNDKRRVNPCTKDDYGVRPECPEQDRPKK
ncbi:MAG TPA: DUF4124 domain-containing protein [Thiopseudomonas sp.]|nr:DUF4124 domain-containing protein [Thiopseudomonas sp.]